ncbi:Tm-1-like ATP-binding domain-containing protein [Zavarzinella formosa]|uniref:Tm-1-like ATP-binding domain-containing protein n=1 Tax=Zavarzinella formosa TaxID=360055 RepID=UPI00030B49F4|nr:Tm-1-like ATP-binding domain-containing protein [Zavarzinella formosa]
MAVLLIGTLDTKGTELAYVRDILQSSGLTTTVIDSGSSGVPRIPADVTREEVFAAAGTSLAAIQRKADRGEAISLASIGVARLVAKLYRLGQVEGIFSLGGSAGTTIGARAMQELPYGLPKVMVSTVAGSNMRGFVGVRDITMMNSVTDICGLNRFSRQILANAANALIGMVTGRRSVVSGSDDKPIITATMFGVTTPSIEQARVILENSNYEVLVFHATGTGGLTMEAMIRDGLVAGSLDITTTELADELVGGILSAGRDRLTAAAIRGIPQVISAGALDMVNFGPRDTVPARFEGRRFHQHNENVTLMRTTPEENDRLGKEIVEKACASNAPTAIILPLRGVSAIDREGGPFWWPEADEALFQSIRNWISPTVKLIELDTHINDAEFSRVAVETLLGWL